MKTITYARRTLVAFGALISATVYLHIAHADPVDHIDIMPAFVSPDDDRGTSGDGYGINFIYAHPVRDEWWWETRLFANELETGSAGGTDFYQYGAGIDAVYAFGSRNELTPFLLAGIGAIYNDAFPDDRDGGDFFANIGTGFVTKELNRNGLKVRGEVRLIHDSFESGQVDWQVGIGVSIPLGRTRVVERIVEKEVIRYVERDDGPADSDGDGVADAIDRCAETMAGAAVNEAGCVAGTQTIVLDNVNFEFDSAELTQTSKVILYDAAGFLRADPDLQVEIAGHTDWKGSADYNMDLSQRRAESVRQYLESSGIGAARMKARGYGESQPIATNETDLGRAQNRRVEFRIK